MDKNQIRETIARRASFELKDGDVVNLGIGLPTQVLKYLSPKVKVIIQSENGCLGMGNPPEPGRENPDLIDAGGGAITLQPGASCFDSSLSFAIIRGGHVDITILGSLQVDEKGNIANWSIPGIKTPGIGGAMDLITGAKKVIVTMEHTAKGEHKILENCTLPLTAAGQVDRIITEMGVMDVTPEGLVLREINSEFTLEEVQKATGCRLIIPKDLKNM
ncbi:MAG TPA: 3-oxoacid CoA-transferase subunit B [Bacteroidales bacterium]|jgi:acetate CoA/acetoacetate CoA-transferase beta subunit|nr:3-oxoacid CoA-transferase subunit B [Bacteroidales bacterium]OQC57839.1 MAG: Butyrate--acetoacetate CoA-transferase subunit B [Bacteroidetes bacterium ADurb.Bin013]MBP8999428.1 3-oxoacid CoA-transferase subunit B [Bacteroidales bacterium]MBV6455678.1 Butyrate--acetoacetate CoA-transferase subunit B [Bacteroidales bacterium]MCZ2316800.1 3-oxoacid CoA-transferase subunit B [Bacteroidales bacterium]